MVNCPVCGKNYKKEGWLLRHLSKTHPYTITEKGYLATIDSLKRFIKT